MDRGDGNLFQTHNVRGFLARYPRGFVVGSPAHQGGGEPATAKAANSVAELSEHTVLQLRALAEERGIELTSQRKADIIAELIAADKAVEDGGTDEDDEED